MKFTFTKLHITWLLIWLAVFILMVMPFMQAGHPPIMVFSPFAIGIGLLGHLFIALMQFIYSRSNKNFTASSDTPFEGNWPWQVILLLVIFSFMAVGAIQGFIAIIRAASFGYLGNFVVILNILIPITGLIALLKRQPLGFRFIQGIGSLLIALLTIYMFIRLTYYRHLPDDFIVLPIAIICIAVYLYLFSKSNRVKSFFRINH